MNRFNGSEYKDSKVESTTDQQQKREAQKRQADSEDNEKHIQQQQSSPKIALAKAEWKQYVGSAKILWGKLTDDEILQTEGHIEKLSGLVKERYLISLNDANQQVEKFLAKCNV